MKNQPEKIKVLFRLRSAEMGGVQRVMFDLLENMPREKFDFTLLLNLYQGELRTEVPKHIRLVSLTQGKEDMSKNPILRFVQLIKRRIKLWYYETFPKRLYKHILKESYDIEVASSYTEFEWVLNSPIKNSRKIGWYHSDASYDKDMEVINRRIELMKKFDWMVFCSDHTRRVFDELFGAKYPNSSVIYNAIRVEEAEKKSKLFEVNYEQHPVFSSLGRLTSKKGYDMLMRVHKKLLDDGFQHSVVLVGGGDDMESLQTQAAELGVEKTFLLLGNKNNPFPYIIASDFFILSSKSEAYPLTIGEAMGLGMPIISTNVGGVPEMIDHGKDGILINVDETEMYEAMKEFMTHPELIKSLKKGALQGKEKFDAQRIYDKLTKVFEREYALKK